MGDQQDGSSRAAHGAHLTDTEEAAGDSSAPQGFFSKLFSAWSPDDAEFAEDGRDGASRTANGAALPGIGNLRRMRVEDVMLPKAEIVAVPDDEKTRISAHFGSLLDAEF